MPAPPGGAAYKASRLTRHVENKAMVERPHGQGQPPKPISPPDLGKAAEKPPAWIVTAIQVRGWFSAPMRGRAIRRNKILLRAMT